MKKTLKRHWTTMHSPEKLEQIYIDILGDLKQEKTILDQQETN